MAPEDVFHNVFPIHMYIAVELLIMHPSFLEESHQLVYIIGVFNDRIRSLPVIG